MRAMILAAGRGTRMKELTACTPKPLLRIKNRYLIEYSILQLVAAGITDIIINISYCAAQIEATIGNGAQYGANIIYSFEPKPLETGGGIIKALPFLDDPFIVLSCDVISNYDLKQLPKTLSGLAHLILVDNPTYHSEGDFGLINGKLSKNHVPKFTYANIGVFTKALFYNHPISFLPLSTLLVPAVERQQVTGEYFSGEWHNIGTPKDIQQFQ